MVHVRVTQDALNHHVWYAQAIQVAPQPATRGVPAVPLGITSIAFEFVLRAAVIQFRLVAGFAAIQRREIRVQTPFQSDPTLAVGATSSESVAVAGRLLVILSNVLIRLIKEFLVAVEYASRWALIHSASSGS